MAWPSCPFCNGWGSGTAGAELVTSLLEASLELLSLALLVVWLLFALLVVVAVLVVLFDESSLVNELLAALVLESSMLLLRLPDPVVLEVGLLVVWLPTLVGTLVWLELVVDVWVLVVPTFELPPVTSLVVAPFGAFCSLLEQAAAIGNTRKGKETKEWSFMRELRRNRIAPRVKAQDS